MIDHPDITLLRVRLMIRLNLAGYLVYDTEMEGDVICCARLGVSVVLKRFYVGKCADDAKLVCQYCCG